MSSLEPTFDLCYDKNNLKIGNMARRYILRYDLWICLAIGFVASLGVEALAKNVLTNQYEQHQAEHVVSAGEVGGEATEEIFRADDVEDLLSHDNFTVISPGIEYRNRGGGYYGGMYLHSITLPSGERVAARINIDNVTKADGSDSSFGGESILPVGRVVMEDLNSNPTFIQQIEYSEPLSRKDFYIDMVGASAIQSEESFIEGPAVLLQLLTLIAVFALTHYLGSKIGLFPAFYTRKRSEAEKKSDWE